ncbi:hypothetical protein ACLBKS_06215 [Hylemonella sp. W303a]|uniref:hypothetical protein n=1 Tax=Hylemonella sp. W303a TaxID=3389873 RepID=UPI00396B2672
MHTNLKTLSRQYASGMISRADYRRARAELIDALHNHDQTQPHTTEPAVTEEPRRQEG